MRKLTVIDLFCGAGGLSEGFRQAGFEIISGIDIDKWACLTFAYNFGNKNQTENIGFEKALELLRKDEFDIVKMRDIRKVEPSEIRKLTNKKIDVVVGGPPCQAFSTAGKRQSINDNRKRLGGDLVFKFIEILNEIKPRFFVFENVSGLKSAAIKHMSFYKRTKTKDIKDENKLGSAFNIIFGKFQETNYEIDWGLLNSADFGVPQKRKRLFIIGSKNKVNIKLPNPIYASPNSKEVKEGTKKPWLTLRDAIYKLRGIDHEFIDLPSWGKYLKLIPPGGSWINLPENLQKEAMKGAYFSQGGRRGFFRRLDWNKPAPTLLTSPIMKATCLAHPEENRPLSVQEYLVLQNFPIEWKLFGGTTTKYRLIGESVPVNLSKEIGKAIIKCSV